MRESSMLAVNRLLNIGIPIVSASKLLKAILWWSPGPWRTVTSERPSRR